ncbi:MAG: phospho-sugar mutase [Flavobacteriales bacterium]|nr:phospho-sugar mutase [Flavobacteriales bacterium]
MSNSVDQKILDSAKSWLSESYDNNTRAEVQDMIDNNPEVLIESFYKDLEFGTGGMRGIMGAGTNRMNKYTLGAATQGLANYLLKQFTGEIKVAIAYDVRNNSDVFSKIVARVLAANGIKVYLFDTFRPTPELSFAVRHLGCQSGIVLTASHNPPEYNGYKVYWEDGSQVVPPHDNGIISEVKNVKVEEIKFDPENEDLIEIIGEEIDNAFVDACVENGQYSNVGYDDYKLVFTPIHGTSFVGVIPTLEKAGFKNVFTVEEQMVPDPMFSTVKSPNPEEPEALAMATKLAEEIDADMVIGTDPDGDRIGIAVRNLKGEMVLLNGNQANTVLTMYLLERWKEAGKLTGTEFIGSTIVTSDIFFELAKVYGIECKVGLTGFKWIADMIRVAEGKQAFIGGGEESFGFMVGDFVRDKDSVTSTLLAAEVGAWAKANGSSYYEELLKVYTKTGYFKEHLIALVKKGISGADEIAQMMVDFRENPPATIDGSKVVRVEDYGSSISTNLTTGEKTDISIPKSNVIILYTEDGTKIAARPSGTEPKIKFYISVRTKLGSVSEFDELEKVQSEKIQRVVKELGV